MACGRAANISNSVASQGVWGNRLLPEISNKELLIKRARAMLRAQLSQESQQLILPEKETLLQGFASFATKEVAWFFRKKNGDWFSFLVKKNKMLDHLLQIQITPQALTFCP